MKRAIENKLKLFRDLLESITRNATNKQRAFADRLLTEIMDEFTIYEDQLLKYRKDITGYQDYEDILLKCVDILSAMGFLPETLDMIEKGAIDLILKNHSKLKRGLTVRDVENINKMYKLYKMEFGEPELLTDLNKIMNGCTG